MSIRTFQYALIPEAGGYFSGVPAERTGIDEHDVRLDPLRVERSREDLRDALGEAAGVGVVLVEPRRPFLQGDERRRRQHLGQPPGAAQL